MLFSFFFNKRFNIITGDNGLGKTFILESIWWMLTNTWTNDPLYPGIENIKKGPSIISSGTEGNDGASNFQVAFYNRGSSEWQKTEESSDQALIIYAKANGIFAVMDPNINSSPFAEKEGRSLVFTKNEIWEGLVENIRDVNSLKSRKGASTYLCNGLINDWVIWQQANDSSFDILKRVLKQLSPPNTSDLGLLIPGSLVRLPYDSRIMPTIKHPYGEIPVIHASEGVRRILSLAYLIVWTWQEHKLYSENSRKDIAKNMVFLIDEIEVHLHPQWQRKILPAMLEVSSELSSELDIQFMITTHSPIVTGSVENIFDDYKDRLFHLDISSERHSKNADVTINDIEFEKRGTIDSWLTSDAFNLDQPRGSIKSEKVISKAIEMQSNIDATKDDVEKITNELRKVLGPFDIFWSRWRSYADSFGIKL
ncbi:AAA family ATPase [Fibrella aestuarina]|nr:ATP-binding protein [Fibrella aestuarina]